MIIDTIMDFFQRREERLQNSKNAEVRNDAKTDIEITTWHGKPGRWVTNNHKRRAFFAEEGEMLAGNSKAFGLGGDTGRGKRKSSEEGKTKDKQAESEETKGYRKLRDEFARKTKDDNGGTYILETEKKKYFRSGYQATFQSEATEGRDSSKYLSDNDYDNMVKRFAKELKSEICVSSGSVPELNFNCENKRTALSLAKKHNKMAIFDWSHYRRPECMFVYNAYYIPNGRYHVGNIRTSGHGFTEFMKNTFWKKYYDEASNEILKEYIKAMFDYSLDSANADYASRLGTIKRKLSKADKQYIYDKAENGFMKDCYRSWLIEK